MKRGYWWQEERRSEKVFRLVVILAVKLGHLPTFEEVREREEGLVSDAAFYYGSYDELKKRVAGYLYGSNFRTCPTDLTPLQKKRLPEKEKQNERARLQEEYSLRLEKLGLTSVDLQDSAAVEAQELPQAESQASAGLDLHEGLQVSAVLESQKLTESDSQGLTKLRLQLDENDRWSENQKHLPSKTVTVVKDVVEQVLEGAMKQLILTEGVIAMRKKTREECIEALRRAYTDIGDNAFKQNHYAKYAGEHGCPALLTMKKNLGSPSEWAQYLEDVSVPPVQIEVLSKAEVPVQVEAPETIDVSAKDESLARIETTEKLGTSVQTDVPMSVGADDTEVMASDVEAVTPEIEVKTATEDPVPTTMTEGVSDGNEAENPTLMDEGEKKDAVLMEGDAEKDMEPEIIEVTLANFQVDVTVKLDGRPIEVRLRSKR